jgi:hypothetical protein
MALPDDAQWFQSLGPCVGCGKPATGFIMGYRNDKRGPACQRCADKAIKLAHKRGKMHPDWVYSEKT